MFDMSKAEHIEKTFPEPADASPLEQINSNIIGETETGVISDGELHRSFSPHQVHIISLGSNVGSGIFIGAGAALAAGGPGNMVIAYSFVCSCVWAVLQTLTEMTIAFPVSGNYINYADRWVDPALAFGAGLAEWLGWTVIVGAEAAFFNILIQFWAGGDFPVAASLTIFVGACCLIFTLPNKAFAWFEYFTSLIKIILFLLIIVLSLAIVLGAGPQGYIHHGEYWTSLPPFKNGFSGFANAAILAVWAVGDQIFIGVMGGEAESPRFSMAKACKMVPYRVSFVYMACVVFITLLVPSDNPNLLGGSGITASPFVLGIESVGIPVVPHILNAGIMCGILAIAAEAVYLSSRVLRTMAHQRLIHPWIAKVDSRGRPRRALYITCGAAVLFTYINLSGGGRLVLNWLIQITATSYFTNWIIVAVTSYRFRQAIRAQNDKLFDQLYSWKMNAYPGPPGWLFTFCMVLLFCSFYLGVVPAGSTLAQASAKNFFNYTLGIWIIFGLTAAYKLIYRTPWRKLEEADLTTGRHELTDFEIDQLNKYYNMPKWRRFLGYLKMW